MLACFPTETQERCKCGHETQLRLVFDVPFSPHDEEYAVACFRCLRQSLTKLQALGANYNGQDLVVEHTDMKCMECGHPLDHVVLCFAEELSASDMALRCSNCGHVVASWQRVEHREGE